MRHSGIVTPPLSDAAFLDQILDHLRQGRGFDFCAYKRSSLMRRVVTRMQTVNVPSFEQYLDYLRVHQEELAALVDTILINVTSFFRDPEVWAYLADDLVPRLVANRRTSDPLRIWSAGCASGQEAYTLAMLVAEQVGLDALRARAKIYATDLDDEALLEAREAVYAERQIADVPLALLEKYFERSGDHFTVSRNLRHAVIFSRHDMIHDAPISRIDLLSCRNTLMYFNADAQSRVLGRFSHSVNASGYLVLGRAEMLFSHSALFVPVDLKRRVFGPAQQQVGVSVHDVGRPPRDLEGSDRPVELRAALDRVEVAPVTEYDSLQDELQKSKSDLEMAYEELQSTVEELETSNDELQSANEELETMNEALQSMNEELQTMNDQLRNRSTELNSAHAYLEAVFASLQSAVIVLDRDCQVKVWNTRAERLWGVQSDQARDTHFLGLDIGLPLDDLKTPIRAVLNGVKDTVDVAVPAVSLCGRPIECRVAISPLQPMDRAIQGVILVIEEQQVPS